MDRNYLRVIHLLIFLLDVINFFCLLKVYTIKAKELSSYVEHLVVLQSSAAAELGCGGKF